MCRPCRQNKCIKYKQIQKQQCEDWEQRLFRPCRNPLLGCGKIHSESERERCWDTHLTWTHLLAQHRTHCTLRSLFGDTHLTWTHLHSCIVHIAAATLCGLFSIQYIHLRFTLYFCLFYTRWWWTLRRLCIAMHCRLYIVEVLVVPFCGDDEICVRL